MEATKVPGETDPKLLSPLFPDRGDQKSMTQRDAE